MWGSIVNRSRDLVRQGLGYIHPRQPELQAALCRWTIAFRCGGGMGVWVGGEGG
jgi:predicted membrane chloride channel (bestrophin family)